MSALITPQIAVAEDAIRAFCERHNVARFALFGSVLRDDFRPDSDIDVLLEFAPGVRYGVSALVAMGDELEALFGRPVDIIDRQAILDSPNPIRRKTILESEQVIYETR
jgi:hypothetical protein